MPDPETAPKVEAGGAAGPSGEEADRLQVEQRFAMVPEWLLDADVPDGAVRLYALLTRYGNSSGARFPSRALLARRLRRSVDSVDRAMRELETAGAVVVHPPQGRREEPPEPLRGAVQPARRSRAGRPPQARPPGPRPSDAWGWPQACGHPPAVPLPPAAFCGKGWPHRCGHPGLATGVVCWPRCCGWPHGCGHRWPHSCGGGGRTGAARPRVFYPEEDPSSSSSPRRPTRSGCGRRRRRR